MARHSSSSPASQATGSPQEAIFYAFSKDISNVTLNFFRCRDVI